MCGFCSTGRQELLSVRLQVEVQLEVEVSSSAGKARFFLESSAAEQLLLLKLG